MAASVGVLSTSSLAVMALRHDDPVSYVSARIESEEVGLVQGVDALEEIFRSKGLLYEASIDPRQAVFALLLCKAILPLRNLLLAFGMAGLTLHIALCFARAKIQTTFERAPFYFLG
jgi:hypothetical protein